MPIQFWWHFASFLSRQPLISKFLRPRKATALLGTMLTKTKISQVCFWINTKMSLLLPSVGCANLNLSLFPQTHFRCIYGVTGPSWSQSVCLFSCFFRVLTRVLEETSNDRHLWLWAHAKEKQRNCYFREKLSLTQGRVIYSLLLLDK